MYGRDVAINQTRCAGRHSGRQQDARDGIRVDNKMRGKALAWCRGSMSIRSLCLFLFISDSCLEHGARGGHAMTSKMVNSLLVRGKALDGVIWWLGIIGVGQGHGRVGR